MSDNTQQLAILMGDKANLPAFARTNAGAELNKEATAGTGGEGINRISLKQSRFRLIVGGEQVSIIPEAHMDVVIVQANPGVSRAYYGGRKYDPNADDQSPDCYSSGGVVPDEDVDPAKKQCDTCANCPLSQWGSRINDNGAKVKACGEFKRMSIVPKTNVEAPMFQVSVPAASLKVFGNFVRMLNQASPAIPYNGIVTRISFDEMSDYPKLVFAPQGWLTDEQYAIISDRYGSEEALRTATIRPTPVATRATNGAKPADAPAPEVDEDEEAVAAAEAQLAAKAKADAEQAAAVKAEAAAKAKAEKAAKAKADKAAAAAKAAEAAAPADAWGAATTAAVSHAEKATAAKEDAATPKEGAGDDAFAAAGWGDPFPPKKDATTPPEKAHVETEAKVSDGGDLDDIFGEGFDD